MIFQLKVTECRLECNRETSDKSRPTHGSSLVISAGLHGHRVSRRHVTLRSLLSSTQKLNIRCCFPHHSNQVCHDILVLLLFQSIPFDESVTFLLFYASVSHQRFSHDDDSRQRARWSRLIEMNASPVAISHLIDVVFNIMSRSYYHLSSCLHSRSSIERSWRACLKYVPDSSGYYHHRL